MVRRTGRGQIKRKLVGAPERRQPPKPEQRIKIARHLFGALCVQYPTRLIALRDENGRIVARNARVEDESYWREVTGRIRRRELKYGASSSRGQFL
jgi:hypothetical protein